MIFFFEKLLLLNYVSPSFKEHRYGTIIPIYSNKVLANMGHYLPLSIYYGAYCLKLT